MTDFQVKEANAVLREQIRSKIEKMEKLIASHNSDFYFSDNQIRHGYIIALEEVLELLEPEPDWNEETDGPRNDDWIHAAYERQAESNLLKA